MIIKDKKDHDNQNSVASKDIEESSDDYNKYGPDGVEFGLVYSLCNGPNDELSVVDWSHHKLIVLNLILKYLQYFILYVREKRKPDNSNVISCSGVQVEW